MIKKEFSLTDVFGALSVVALMISVLSNAFFYYSLDAMWVMSILSPSFYIFEILKVILFLAGSISCVGFLMDAYKWLVSKSFKLRKKKHYKLSVDNSEKERLQRILILQNRKFQFWQSLFVIVIFTLIVTILQIYRWIDFASMLWMSLIVGMVLGILTHAEVKQDKALKFFILIILVAITTCLSAQLKLNQSLNYLWHI